MERLPYTNLINPRPVWARHLRRFELGEQLGPPTEAEKHDAILVLEAQGWGITPLLMEAEQIFIEASE
jgi:hypothetical protein